MPALSSIIISPGFRTSFIIFSHSRVFLVLVMTIILFSSFVQSRVQFNTEIVHEFTFHIKFTSAHFVPLFVHVIHSLYSLRSPFSTYNIFTGEHRKTGPFHLTLVPQPSTTFSRSSRKQESALETQPLFPSHSLPSHLKTLTLGIACQVNRSLPVT